MKKLVLTYTLKETIRKGDKNKWAFFRDDSKVTKLPKGTEFSLLNEESKKHIYAAFVLPSGKKATVETSDSAEVFTVIPPIPSLLKIKSYYNYNLK